MRPLDRLADWWRGDRAARVDGDRFGSATWTPSTLWHRASGETCGYDRRGASTNRRRCIRGCAADHLTKGLAVRTDETTSRIAWVVVAANSLSAISPSWLAPAMTRCALLVDKVARL